MASASRRAAIFAAALGLAALTAALPASAEADASAAASAVPEAERGPGDDAAGHQTLSTLGALALGVLGLLWVRRHTADL